MLGKEEWKEVILMLLESITRVIGVVVITTFGWLEDVYYTITDIFRR